MPSLRLVASEVMPRWNLALHDAGVDGTRNEQHWTRHQHHPNHCNGVLEFYGSMMGHGDASSAGAHPQNVPVAQRDIYIRCFCRHALHDRAALPDPHSGRVSFARQPLQSFDSHAT